ncbi:MAG: hypothetical protein IT345_10615 [Trueperaceae bacterium]|nr:hypothetical protein [Trueperaceae bacterium]
MASLSDIRTGISRDLRDTSNTTWTTAEVDDLINQGIDALADFYPKEIVQAIGTVAASVFTYDVSAFTNIYRVDINDGSVHHGSLPPSAGDGRNSGWETHAGVLYTPPNLAITAGYVLTAFGYGRYAELTSDEDETDMDAAGIKAVRVFAQAEALSRLIANRAAFQQWQASPTNTDVTLLALTQTYRAVRGRWMEEQRRLRRPRKLA